VPFDPVCDRTLLALLLACGTTLSAGTGSEFDTAPAKIAAASMVPPDAKSTPHKAVQDGLAWLARHQNPDGTWGAMSLKARCNGGKCCAMESAKPPFGDHYDEGITGLAILAFLRAGYGSDSKQEIVDVLSQQRWKPGEVVTRALDALKTKQRKDGAFAHERVFMYNHAIATLAMAEACVATKSDAWTEPAQRAIDLLEAAQRKQCNGDQLWGWRYATRRDAEASAGRLPKDEAAAKALCDADISVTAWAIAALSAAQHAKLNVRKESLDGALDYCDYVTLKDGRVGYTKPEEAGMAVTGVNDSYNYHTASMSALGMIVRLHTGHDRKHPFFELAAQLIVKDLPTISSDKLSIDYYYWYQGSSALNAYEGEGNASPSKKRFSGPWNKAATQALLDLQDHAKTACSNGGWITGDRWAYAGGPAYCTAMAVMSLEACNPK
jgi:hypothetical protein